jgi:sulfite exporter TauE/SafE
MSCSGAAFTALGLGGLFSLGLLGSLHCLAMCGPLSCLAGGGRARNLIPYHLARLASYAALGFLLYSLGKPLRLSLPFPLLLSLLSLPLLAYALLPSFDPPPFLAALHAKGYALARRFPPLARSLALGLLTPLLPCGLLYAAASASLAAPSAALAAAWMLAFAAGTFPLLVAGQFGWRLGELVASPRALNLLQRGGAGLAGLSTLAFALLARP